jgi:hypothetical protein
MSVRFSLWMSARSFTRFWRDVRFSAVGNGFCLARFGSSDFPQRGGGIRDRFQHYPSRAWTSRYLEVATPRAVYIVRNMIYGIFIPYCVRVIARFCFANRAVYDFGSSPIRHFISPLLLLVMTPCALSTIVTNLTDISAVALLIVPSTAPVSFALLDNGGAYPAEIPIPYSLVPTTTVCDLSSCEIAQNLFASG